MVVVEQVRTDVCGRDPQEGVARCGLICVGNGTPPKLDSFSITLPKIAIMHTWMCRGLSIGLSLSKWDRPAYHHMTSCRISCAEFL